MYDQYQGKKYLVTKICSQMASGTATTEYHKLRILTTAIFTSGFDKTAPSKEEVFFPLLNTYWI